MGRGGIKGDADKLRAAIILIIVFTVLFCGVSTISFYVLKPVRKAVAFVQPYTNETLEAVADLRKLERQVDEDSFDGATLRADITAILPAMNITSFSTKMGKGRLIAAEVKGLVRMDDIQDLFIQLNRPAMDVTGMKLSSRLNFNVRSPAAEAGDVVFDVSISLSFVKK